MAASVGNGAAGRVSTGRCIGGRRRAFGYLILASSLAVPAAAAGDRMAGAALPAAQAREALEVSLRLDNWANNALRIDLPPTTTPTVARKGREPLRIGFHRDVPAPSRGDLVPRLKWTELSDGTIAAAVLVFSPDATSIRVGLRAVLPAGGELRFFHPANDGEAVTVVAPPDLAGGQDVDGAEAEPFWSPSVAGDAIGIEIALPSRDALGAASLRVGKVAHRFLDPRATTSKVLECPELHVDVQCRVGAFPSGLENAVARLEFETDLGTALCSGTLLNDGDADTFIPYFLTAQHCISTAEEARTVQATWFYQRANCDTAVVDPRATTTFGGAEIIATNAARDATLLKLRRRLPAGVFFAGWDAEEVLAADAVLGIHHPDGVVKKYAAGEVASQKDSDGVVDAVEVYWDEGVTEGGSSGSAIFRDGLAIGTLSHGAVCSSGIYRDYYGPFASFYPQVCSALNPGGGCGDGEHDLAATAREIAVGGTAADAVDEAGDVDYWRIAVPSYGTLVVETTGDADTVGTLEDAQGYFLGTDDDSGAGRNFRLERIVDSGAYYVRVVGVDDAVGDYVLRTTHTPIPSDGLPAVAWDQNTIGGLTDSHEVDYWRLEVEADAAIAVFTSGNVDTAAVLEGAGGETLAENDDGGVGFNFRIDALLPAGAYRLKVHVAQRRGGEGGLYTLHASQTPLADIPAIAEDGSAGEIDAPNESNYWRIDVPSLSVSTVETTGATDTVGRLYTAAGEQTAFDDDGGADTNFRLERLLAAGTYYGRIRAYEDETGSYTVTANHVALAAEDILALGAGGTASIGEPGEEDIWRFDLSEATVVTVETTGSLDTFGVLEDGFGRTRTDDDSGRGTNFRISAEMAAGTHYLRVSAFGAATGDYTLHLRRHLQADVGDTPATAAELAIGTIQESAIGPVRDVDYWRVEVPSAGTLLVESEGSTDTLVAVEDVRGVKLAEDDDSGDVRNFRLRHEVFPGTYFLRVSGYSTATGAYALHAEHARSISIPWFLAARNAAQGRQGFARLINHSARTGTVRIHAIDDSGAATGSIDLALQAGETVHFNSDDLEAGNPAKGIAAGIGPGVGDWRLALETDLDLNALAYVRTAQGFLTSMHDLVPRRQAPYDSSNRYVVPIFNPASNRRQVSQLRLFNLGDQQAAVTITGLDDNGEPHGGGVRLALAPNAARTFTAEELERGGEDIDGSLGDGSGKWELSIGSTEPLGVMNLLESRPPTAEAGAGSNLTNLSTVSAPPAIAPRARRCAPCEVPLFIAADDPQRQGFVRLSNHSQRRGSVTIHAIDDTGRRAGPVTLAMDAGETVHFNSEDLERGNSAKGLSGSVGDGVGDWRLEVRTDLEVVGPLAYARTSDGFLTSLHDLVRGRGDARRSYRVPIFNPASNRNQRSQLRIVNPSMHSAAITIAGIDDRGQPGSLGEVSFTLPAGHARTIDAEQLEMGHTELTGRLGDGAGKWQLRLDADQPVRVLNLLLSANGNLTNLSSSPQR